MAAQVIELRTRCEAEVLPSRRTPWLPGNPDKWGGTKSVSALQSAVTRAAEAAPWQWPGRPVHFITDPHADAEAFVNSLVATGGARRDGRGITQFSLTEAGRESVFILGGDCLDKGPSNLELLRSIRAFQQTGARFVPLAGNHDVRLLVGLRAMGVKGDPLTEHLFLRMGPKVVPLFREVYEQYGVGNARWLSDVPKTNACRRELFPSEDWFESFPRAAADRLSPAAVARELKRMRRKLETFEAACADAGLSLRDVYAAALQCRRLFLDADGEFAWFARDLRLAHREGAFLFVHAGLDDEVAGLLASGGVEALNREYRRTLREDLFGFYFGPVANTMRTKYRAADLPLTADGVATANGAGIHVVMNGHRSRDNGQRIMLRKGMLHIECDITLDRSSRRKEGLAGVGRGYTSILPSGEVIGVSSDYPCVKAFRPGAWIREAGRRSNVAG